ncbi:MAG TPA: isoprenylcysteine carboxyl methyltransferase [Gammaproteobacteria bacterium]|nr:isoprenylcysteine carboxyl methyltransferase [Gammaproteobacteria bacterium]
MQTLPKSAVHGGMALVGLAVFVTGVVLVRALRPWDEAWQASLSLMAWIAVLLLGSDMAWNKVHRRASTGLDAAQHDPSWSRTGVKLLGLVITLGLLGAAYMIFPVYDDSFYGPFFTMLVYLVPAWLVAAPPYFYLVDRRMREPQDGYWHLGSAVLLRWNQVDARMLGQHLLGWTVKGFFLPLMFAYMCSDMGRVLAYGDPDGARLDIDVAYDLMYFVDVTLVSVGYLVTFRVTDTHIRSTEPTFLGWAVALACYQPFWGVVSGQYLAYRTDYGWQQWLSPGTLSYAAWGVAILALTGIYLWATLSFAGRFSNLTHRGILTNGPYRFSKHPAYLAKNLSWWLIAAPFLAHGGLLDGALRCLMLLGVNVIYWLRARTEERHLSADPVYVQYAMWVEQHGVLRDLPRVRGLGFLRYRVPEV